MRDWYVVFQGKTVVKLTASSKEATQAFLESGDGLYRVKNLEELSKVLDDRKKWAQISC